MHVHGEGDGGEVHKTNLLEALAPHWSGVAPALVLCLNPAVHFAVYDTLKVFLTAPKDRPAGLTLTLIPSLCFVSAAVQSM